MPDWYSVDTAEQGARLLGAWPDAPLINEETCEFLLEIARDQVIDFAPVPATIPEGSPVPDPPARNVYAQLQQAKNLWEAGRVSSDGDLGEGGYTFQPRPLDKTIREIIRPINRRPRVR